MKVFRSHLLVCGGTGCHASGSIAMKKALVDELNKRSLSEEIKVVETGCNGFCAQGPIIVVYPEGIIYMNIRAEDIPELVEEHFIKGRPLERLFYKEPGKEERIPSMQEIPFFALQDLRVLRNRGLIDPENIEEYIARDGYAGMAKALTEMTPEQIVQEVLKSGLRGRGGAGFPTGLKWQFASRSPGETKYVLCNADEGDPGAFMDRSVLEADPHAVLEGMVIAAKAIGSSHGYIYCRAEYPLAIHRLNVAIGQARESGLLGKDILGTGFDFDIEIYQGAGAFVCGEETALMTSIEGKRGMPRPRPPFPAVAGLWDKPSVLNNVETLANIGQIMLRGGEWYAKRRDRETKGTKVFALTGDVNNVGLVEVPMGTTLGTIVYDIGGGIPGGKKFKAAQLGGPSGGCIPVQHLNASVDYEKVAELGAIMGSGGLIVMNEDKLRRRHGALLHGLLPGRVLRQVHPLPRGHEAHARHPDQDLQGQGQGRRHRAARVDGDGHQGRGALRPRPDGPEPRAQHDPLLPQRVRGTHPRQEVPRRRLLGPLQVALPAHLPDRDGHPVLHRADPRQPVRGRLQGHR